MKRALTPQNISQQKKAGNFAVFELKKMAKFIRHML